MFSWGHFLLEEVDKKPSKALHHAYFQPGDGHQLVEQLDEQHMVFFAEFAPIQSDVPNSTH